MVHNTGNNTGLARGKCSTPFGIKRMVHGPFGRGVRTGGRVLNAFRHQRWMRPSWLRARNYFSGMCSTPFGIKGWSILGTIMSPDQRMRCSTPFGIKEVHLLDGP